jgi:hypothetical protein
MALSLAACGSSDDENFKEFATEEAYNAVITGAKADATTAAEAAAKIAQDAAVAAVDKSTDDAAAILEAVVAVDATATTVSEVATNAAAAVDKSTDDAAAITKAVSDGTSGAYTTVASLFAAYDAAANPPAASAALTGSTDIVTGTSSNDTFTGTTATYAVTDVVSDSSTSDSDTFTFTASDDDDLDGSIVNIETINVNVSAFSTAGVAASWESNIAGISAGSNIVIDVTQAGSGVSAATLTNVDSITVTGSTSILDLTLTTDADSDVTVVSNYVGADEFDLVIAAAAAQMDTLTVTSADDLHIVDTAGDEVAELVTATSAGDIEISATGAAAAVLTAANEVVMTDIDGATTLTLSSVGTGFGATGAASAATAESSIATAAALTTVNVSGNGGDTRLDVTAGQAVITTINMSGAHDVTVEVSGEDHDTLAQKLTVTDTTTAGETTLIFNAASTGNAIDTRTIATDKIDIGADFAGETFTTATTGQHFELSADQGAAGTTFTAALASAATNSITVEATDNVTTTTGATAVDRSLDVLTFTNYGTVNVVATDNFNIDAAGGLTAGTAKLVVTGSGAFANVTTGQITASEIDASAMTGASTLFLDGDVISTVTTGSAGDTITLEDDAAAGFTIKTNAGGDTLNLGAIDTSVTIDAGDGIDTVTMTASIDLSGQTFSLTDVEILDLDLTGAGASTLTVDSAQLTGKSLSVLTTTGTDDILTVTVDGATADMSGLNIEAASIAVNIDATTFTGVSATNITGTNDADNIDIDGGVGSTASGGGGADNIAGGAGADTIDGGSGGDTITGGGGADNITGGEGGDTITSGNGDDTINLTETTAAVDTLITSGAAAGTAISHDTVTGFGAGTGGDEVDIDLSNVTALATQVILLDDAANHGGAGNSITSTVSAAFDMANLTANTDILVIGGGLTFASSGAVADALESGGSVALTMNGTDTAGDVFMVLYSDGSNSHLAAIESNTAAGDNQSFSAGELVSNDVMTFSGISDATTFAATNFDFIA